MFITQSKKNVIRGMHYNKKKDEEKLVYILEGKILDVTINLNKGKNYGKVFYNRLKKNDILFIPKGFAHGYLTLSDSAIVNYQVDNYYNPEAEEGITYDDNLLKIDWGVEKSKIIISKKDQNFKPFKW